MRTLFYILQKEFTQIFRNKSMLPIIFVMPLVQMLILVFAATNELPQVDLAIVDFDHSASSRKLVAEITGNPFFKVRQNLANTEEAEDLLMRNKINLALIIPQSFDKDLTINKKTNVQILVDAINGNAAQLSLSYLSNVIGSFSQKVLINTNTNQRGQIKSIIIKPTFWFNPQLNYKFYMAPGILVVLITVVGMLLGGMNLVREKELGTIEQINVTPLKKWQFIAGKLLPFLVIGLFDLGFGLLVARLAFNIPIRGSLFLLFGMAAIYLVLVLSWGLFISTISDTQQQATFVAFFSLIVFIMMSGLFTPVESMPDWAQKLDFINPLYYFVKIMRSIILKGSNFADIFNEFAALSAFAVSMFGLAIFRYKKTS
jgi:ABC-2 type transport system permease protein